MPASQPMGMRPMPIVHMPPQPVAMSPMAMGAMPGQMQVQMHMGQMGQMPPNAMAAAQMQHALHMQSHAQLQMQMQPGMVPMQPPRGLNAALHSA